MSKFIISESEKQRILEMHQNATSRQYLMEADVPADPAWLKTAKDKLMGENTYPFLAIGIIKAGATYSTPTNMVFFEPTEGAKGGLSIGIIAKGAIWKPSTSLTVAYCPMTVYNGSELSGTPSGVFDINKLLDINTQNQLVNGTFKVNGKVVKGTATNAVWYPTTSKMISTAGGKLMYMSDATDYGAEMRTNFLAIKNDNSGQPGPGGQYKG